MRNELDVVRRLRNQNINHRRGCPMTQNPPRSREEIWLLLCGGDNKGFLCLSSFGGQSGPSYLGDGDRDKERRLMHQGRLALGDRVQLVVSDSLWPTGKK